MTAVIGLDLSLTSTGYAHVTAVLRAAERIRRPQYTGTERLRAVRDAIEHRVRDADADLVVLEGYAFGRPNQAHQLGELHGVVRVMLDTTGVPWCVIPPASLKKYATGKGNADKGLMLTEAVRRLGYAGSSNDEADALWLACAGHHLLGHPVIDVPKINAAALAAIDMGDK